MKNQFYLWPPWSINCDVSQTPTVTDCDIYWSQFLLFQDKNLPDAVSPLTVKRYKTDITFNLWLRPWPLQLKTNLFLPLTPKEYIYCDVSQTVTFISHNSCYYCTAPLHLISIYLRDPIFPGPKHCPSHLQYYSNLLNQDLWKKKVSNAIANLK